MELMVDVSLGVLNNTFWGGGSNIFFLEVAMFGSGEFIECAKKNVGGLYVAH